MRKKFTGAIAAVLSLSVCLSIAGCAGNSDNAEGDVPKLEIGSAEQTDSPAWTEKAVSIPEYDKIGSMLFENGQSDYSIVIAADAATNTYTAASELNYFVSLASGVSFSILEADSAVWSESAHYISIGDNAVSEAAGVTVPETLNSHGFVVRTVGESLFLQGVTSTGDIFAVYDLLSLSLIHI